VKPSTDWTSYRIAAINLTRIILVLNCNVVSDFTYCTLDSAILTVAEMAVGVMVACVPKMGPVFRHGREPPAASSTRHLQHHNYGFGSEYNSKRTHGSSTKDQVRFNDRESADTSVHASNRQAFLTPLQHHVSGRAFSESELELGQSGDGTNVYATFSHGGSGLRGDGIVVARNFGVTEMRNVD
jgi:hypothetical protein